MFELSSVIKESKKEKTVVIISTVLPGTLEEKIVPLLNEYVRLCYNIWSCTYSY